MRYASQQLGLDWKLRTSRYVRQPGAAASARIRSSTAQPARIQRFTCRLCGECDIGCNYGSKNTLDFNYLTAFERQGGEIRTRSEVRIRADRGSSFVVRYVTHEPAREGRADGHVRAGCRR